MFYFSTKFKDCPTPGFYGERCSSSCPTNCVNGHCNGRGECVGCIIGYQGVHCDKGRCLFVSLSRSFCMTLSSHYMSLYLSVSLSVQLAHYLCIYLFNIYISFVFLGLSLYPSHSLSLSLTFYLYLSLVSVSVFLFSPSLSHLNIYLSLLYF